MRRLSPFAFLAAAGLFLCTTSDDAAAGRRSHGFAGKGRAHFAGHRHGGFRHGLHRHHRHFGFHHGRFHHGRFGRGALFGGFWPGYLDNGYGGQPSLYIQQNVAAGYPTVLDLPVAMGIPSAPVAQPVVYVINGAGTRHQPVLMRKGSRDRPGAKMLAVNPGREIGTTGSLARSASGPRIVEVTARRGL
jgi:hypothetical protein